MLMKKSYSTYKETDIPWIGKVPAHWKVMKLSQSASVHFISNRNVQHQNLLSLSYGKIVRKDIDSSFGLLPSSFDNYQIIEPGNIVLRLTDLQNDQKSLRVGLCNEVGIITSAYLAIQSREYVLSSFLYLALHIADVKKVFYGLGSGLRQSLNWTGLRRIDIPIPPMEEQLAIVEYLERKVGEIDHFLELTEQRIERLRELKQAVISEAVTRGIDPSAPLTPSGILWLGNVPAHWKVMKLSQIASAHFISNKNVQHQNLLSLSYGQIVRKDIDSSFGLLPSSFDNYQIIKPGNIVLRLTDLQNDQKSLRVGLCNEVGIITSAYLVLQSREYVLSSFLYLALHIADVKKVFYGLGSGLRQSLSWTGLRRIDIPIPPVEEQKAIVEYIEERVGRIDRLVASYEEQLERVRELKQSIISEAVTGQVCLV